MIVEMELLFQVLFGNYAMGQKPPGWKKQGELLPAAPGPGEQGAFDIAGAVEEKRRG